MSSSSVKARRHKADSAAPTARTLAIRAETPHGEVSETECISYLLRQIPDWKERGWVCEHCSELLVGEYNARIEALAAPELPTGCAPPSARASAVAAAKATDPLSATAVLASPDEELSRPALSEFLEAHSMKLVALLAALFIFVGMRQVLSWNWAGGTAHLFIPLFPLTLASMLYYFGVRSGNEKTFGGYAYCAVAIILSAFVVFSINEHWLSGALSTGAALTAALGAATSLTAITLYWSKDRAFLHLLLGGSVASLESALHLVRPSSWLLPNPPAIFGIGMLVPALICVLAARSNRRSDEAEIRNRESGPLFAWAAALIAFASVRTFIEVLAGSAGAFDLGLVLALASGVGAVYANRSGRSAAVYLACSGWVAAALMLLVGAGRFEWCGLSLVWLALSAAFFTPRFLVSSEKPFAATANERRSAYLAASSITSWLAFTAAIAWGLCGHLDATLMVCLAACAAWSIVAMTLDRRSGHAASSWPLLLVFSTSAIAGFWTHHAMQVMLTDSLIGASAGILSAAWIWHFAAVRFERGYPPLAPRFELGAAIVGIVGAAVATIDPGRSPVWMSAVLLCALALIVTMGVRRQNALLIAFSLTILILCPLRLSGAAFGTGGETFQALAAVLFALCASPIFAAAAWKIREPRLAWLVVCALGIAMGGGVLFGGHAGPVSRAIGWTSLAGVTAGAAALFLSVHRSNDRWLACAAGALGLAAQLRLLTIAGPTDRMWLGLELLPILLLFSATGRFRSDICGADARQSLKQMAVLTAFATMALLAAKAEAIGGAAFYPLVITLFSYAFAFGVIAVLGAGVDHPLGSLSTAALLGGWFFGLQVPRTDIHGIAVGVILITVTAVCSGLYAATAMRLGSQPPAYGAAAAAVCAWIGLFARIGGLPEVAWSAAAAPALVALYLLGTKLVDPIRVTLSMPPRRTAAVAAGAAAAWAVVSGPIFGGPGWQIGAAATLSLFSALLLMAAVYEKSPAWAGSAIGTSTAAFGLLLYACCPSVASWSLGFALFGSVILAAGIMAARFEYRHFETPCGIAASLITATAAGTALAGMGSYQTGILIGTLVVCALNSIGLNGLRRSPLHLHAAFACLLPAYVLALVRYLHIDASLLSLYLLPPAVYLLIVAQAASNCHHIGRAWTMRWVGLLMLLVPSFREMLDANSLHGSPAHALLLLAECVGVVALGIAGRIGPFVQAGTIFAIGFVVVSAMAAAEIWTGLFTVLFGILLLAAVFYLSVNQSAVRGWLNRAGGGWHGWR